MFAVLGGGRASGLLPLAVVRGGRGGRGGGGSGRVVGFLNATLDHNSDVTITVSVGILGWRRGFITSTNNVVVTVFVIEGKWSRTISSLFVLGVDHAGCVVGLFALITHVLVLGVDAFGSKNIAF